MNGGNFMWSRKIFKTRAKNVLSKTYWISFALCLIAGLLGGFSSIGYQFSYKRNIGSYNPQEYIRNGFFDSASFWHDYFKMFFVGGVIFAVLMFAIAFSLAYTFFLTGPISVGKNRFFLENRKGKTDFGDLFYAFKGGKYLEIVKTVAWQALFTILWTMLLFIPGIIKGYSYILTPYIISDNPKIGYRRALKLSMQMTQGFKWKIFVLHLSFIGWYLLGLLCCGLGLIFLAPYFEATMAEMYGTMRLNAIDKGIITPAELNLSQLDYDADSWGFKQA